MLEKAELKIRQQKKVIEELQKGNPYNFSRLNGRSEKSITMHMVGDEEEDYNDFSSVGSQSFAKSAVSNQEKVKPSLFG